MEYAGHAVVFSGLDVAVGLAGLVLLPLPFIQSMGIGGLLIPLVSIAAATTFLPALLSLWGHRLGRGRVIPRRVLERRDDARAGLLGAARALDHAPAGALPRARRLAAAARRGAAVRRSR